MYFNTPPRGRRRANSAPNSGAGADIAIFSQTPTSNLTSPMNISSFLMTSPGVSPTISPDSSGASLSAVAEEVSFVIGGVRITPTPAFPPTWGALVLIANEVEGLKTQLEILARSTQSAPADIQNQENLEKDYIMANTNKINGFFRTL